MTTVSVLSSIEQYRGLIEAALAYSGGTHDFEDIVAGVTSGTFRMWAAPESVAITEILVYPKKKVFHVFLAAGNKSELTGLIDAAAAFGRSQGCSKITMSGRAGWRRVLANHGFGDAFVTMHKDL